MEEYYNTKEFRKLLRRYQKARRTGVSDYFMASELGDIIQYYAVQGKNDKAMEVSDFTLNLYPGAVEPLAFKARYALSVEDDPDQAQAYADLVEDKTDVEYYYLVAEILIHKEEIGTMENYLRARYAELSKKDKDEFALDVAQMMDDYRLTELALSWLDLVKDRKHPDYKSIKGKVLVFSGLHDVDGEGERLLEELTNDEPYNVDRWLDLAQAQKSKQHNKECVESCDYAIAIDPQNAKAIYLKGGALVAMEHYEEALELFKSNNDLLKKETDGLSSLTVAICLTALGRDEESYQWLDDAIWTCKDQLMFFMAIYFCFAGTKYLPRLYPQLKRVFALLGKNNKHYWSYMALMALEVDQMEDFHHYLQQAIKRNPDEAQLMLSSLFPIGSDMADWPSLTPQKPIIPQSPIMDNFSFFQFIIEHLNYAWVWFLMLLESTVIPVPSELVVTPAAYFAHAGKDLNTWWVIVFATIGADCGATINYLAGYYLGRPLIYRFANSRLGRLCLLTQEKVEKSERYFDNHGMVATITGRLIPGIRHLISIPAGLARMNYWKFLLYTTIGAGAWHAILALLGWYLSMIIAPNELEGKIMEYSHHIKFVILALVAVAVVWFVAKWLIGRAKKSKA